MTDSATAANIVVDADQHDTADDDEKKPDVESGAAVGINVVNSEGLVDIQLEPTEDSADDSIEALKSMKLDDERFSEVSLDTDSRRSADAAGVERPVGGRVSDSDSVVEEKEEAVDDVPSDSDGTSLDSRNDVAEAERAPEIDTKGGSALPLALKKTTILHSTEETEDETFNRLTAGLRDGTLSHKDVVDSVFQVLVGGPFDLESKFIIQNSSSISKMMDLLDQCPPSLQAEMWSMFVAIVRKSNRNLEACSRASLIKKALDRLPTSDVINSDLLVELLGVLSCYSINVKETKRLLKSIKANNGVWPRNSAKLLQVMKQMPKREGPDVFFSFPGAPGSGIALPPLSKWPYQNGWTFSTWLRMDPMNSVNFEKERPFVYCFRTSKGLGYSMHFMGNCLVLTAMKMKPGRGFTRCVKHELSPRKWHHVAISHVYSRWGRSEIHCYIDGHLAEAMEMTWLVNTTDHFDKCFIGCSPEGDLESSFCGQMGALYVFTEAITLQQANSLYCLGPGYQSHFKHEAECDLPEGYKKYLFDGRLSNALMMAYCPKNCDRQLCLESSPKGNVNYFLQIPHAAMKHGVEVVTTHSIHSSLHSVGGIQMLLPLFAQLDTPHVGDDGIQTVDYNICSTLLSVIALLLETSPSSQQQLYQNKGFLVIAHALHKASKQHLTATVLEAFIGMAKFLLTCPAGIPLLKQLFDYILFAPELWIHTPATIQTRLYNYLATDFLANAQFIASIRPQATVVQMLHALKYYYWVVDPRARSGFAPKGLDGPRPSRNDIVAIRSALLAFIKRLITKPPTSPDVEMDAEKDEELQSLLNFVATVHEDDNLYDVLAVTSRLLSDEPSTMVPAFDRKKGVAVVFKLLASPNELVRLPGLKMLGYFLCRATLKRKTDVVGPQNLFTLLTDRLLLSASHLSLATYNVLYELLTEQMTPSISYVKHTDPTEDTRFENSMLLKVIANLISQSQQCDEMMEVKKLFLNDMIALCQESKDNRRTILQMSVWQEWLISLAYVLPANDQETEVSSLVYRLFGILLHHAVRLEYGGWRVWVDTLAIAHSKVSFELFRRDMAAKNRAYSASASPGVGKESVETVVKNTVSDLVDKVVSVTDSHSDIKKSRTASITGEQPSSIYRTPEFRWSKVHLRLLSDLLLSIENDVAEWRLGAVPIIDQVNASDNQVFVANTVHILSQLIDSLIMACGGLLPLLAAATSPNSELEIVDSTQQDLAIEDAAAFLIRFVALAETFIFASALSFSDLEQEKNMPSGGILRQALRLVATISVRNILACRLTPTTPGYVSFVEAPGPKQHAKREAIRRFVDGVGRDDDHLHEIMEAAVQITDSEYLLQESDLSRLKAVVYRDMEESRQAQFLALAVTYLLSVLMVSRYRDILEPPSSPSPFFDTGTGTPRQSTEEAAAQQVTSHPQLTNGSATEADAGSAIGSNGKVEHSEDDDELKPAPISSIKVNSAAAIKPTGVEYKPEQLNRLNGPKVSITVPKERQTYLTTKLQKALETSAPLLREIISDFRSFLQKTLLGTHSQEIMNDAKVLATLRNQQGSVIELVMLLCSQEWQTSLQKHAGLAFIELVNEGRLMAHATRDHVLRVANEADFILNRLRAEDVTKHSEFEAQCAQTFFGRKEEEKTNDHLISAARRRDYAVASRILEKITTILTSPSGAWCQDDHPNLFWRLDIWEDDSRRRKRFVPNPYGSSHPEATLKAAVQHGASDEDLEKAREEMLAHLVAKKIVSPAQLKTGASLADLVDESDIDKWANEADSLVDGDPLPEVASYSTRGRLIAPGVVVPGIISITATDLYFDCDEEDPEYKEQDPKVLRYCDNLHTRWHFNEIRAIFLRRYLLQNTALELFLASRTAIMFAFPDHATVKKVVQHLPRVGVGVKYGLPQSRKTSLMSPRQLFKHSDMPLKWQRREISNFDYLMFLNTVAGRTFNDLNQYPVFPWIIANYESDVLDLNVASNFRDLSKPIGALTASRRKYFEDRYANWEHDSIPPFHYGTHYSTSAFTLNWLIRTEPFSTMFLHLQGGKFDQADRTFHNLAETWAGCQRDSHDVKELIPELYFMPEMFRNSNGFRLGKRDDGVLVNDVQLPPWAKSPEHFVVLHRQALESDLVSCQLNQWIDLIFGYKQRGPEAVRAANVFYYLTYEGALDLNSIEDAAIRKGLEQQMKSFGQTPVQLMTEPHPPRQSVMTISPMMFQPVADDLCMVMKFISNSPIVHLSANTFQQLTQPTVVSIAQNLGFALNRWNPQYSGPQTSTALPATPTDKTPQQTVDQNTVLPNLPLTVDPLLAAGNPAQPLVKRHLGDPFDQRLTVRGNNFVTTVDSRCIMACGYPDYSFRVIETENAKVRQVVYGHGNVVTCLARSECNLFADCYIASGSADCTVLLWHWNAHAQMIAGEYNMPGESPAPRAILTGHDAEITVICISAEHGLIVSGSKDGVVLIHTTQGDLLRRLTPPKEVSPEATPRIALMSRECYILVVYNKCDIVVYTASGRVLNYLRSNIDIEEELFQCACMTRDGEYALMAGDSGVVNVFRVFGLEKLYSLPACDSPVKSLTLSTNHRFVLVGLHSGAIVVFNIDFNKWHYEYRQRYSQH